MVQTVIYTSPMWFGFDMDATVGVNWVSPTSPTQGLNHADSHMTTPIWACLSLTLCCRGRPSITAPRPLRWTEVTELRRGDEVPVNGGWGGELRRWAARFFFSLHLNSIYVQFDSMGNLGHESVRVLYPAVCHVCYACPAPSGWHVSRPLKRDKYSEERMINDEEGRGSVEGIEAVEV